MTARPDHLPPTLTDLPDDPGSDLGYCTMGETLCRLRYWTESQWAALPPEHRPAVVEHVPGRGWLAAVPVRGQG